MFAHYCQVCKEKMLTTSKSSKPIYIFSFHSCQYILSVAFLGSFCYISFVYIFLYSFLQTLFFVSSFVPYKNVLMLITKEWNCFVNGQKTDVRFLFRFASFFFNSTEYIFLVGLYLNFSQLFLFEFICYGQSLKKCSS